MQMIPRYCVAYIMNVLRLLLGISILFATLKVANVRDNSEFAKLFCVSRFYATEINLYSTHCLREGLQAWTKLLGHTLKLELRSSKKS